MPVTWTELWNFLRQLPSPSTTVILSGGVVEYYVKKAYDFLTAKLEENHV